MIEKKNPQDTTTTDNDGNQRQIADSTTNPQLTNHNYLDDSTIYDNMIFPS